jgi:hypothetical protein
MPDGREKIKNNTAMRHLSIFILLLIALAACENQEQVFPDYDLQAVYFPIQLPLRTLSLGEDRIDNTLDREHKFDIGVSIGGMYENKWDWTVDYVLDETLTDNALNGSGAPLIALPQSYYTMSPPNTVVIPAGSFNGLVRIELTDAFFNDPLSLTGQYVVPLRITGTTADSVLSGKPARPGEVDRRVLGDWESGKAPKDWVLYGIKYVNAYHGTYLHRGRDIQYSGGVPVDTVVFREQYVEKDLLMKLTSMSLQRVYSNGLANRLSNTGKLSMELEFDNPAGTSGSIVIYPRESATVSVTGSGEYFDKAGSTESWTGLTWQSMYLQYSWDDGTNVHQVYDTLVFRDRGIKYEVNAITITP